MVIRFNPDAGRSLLVGVLIALLAGTASAERIPVPTPPGGGEGISVFPQDQLNPLDLEPPGPRRDALPRGAAAGDDRMRGNIGGDDVEIARHDYAFDCDMAVSSDGTLFALLEWTHNLDAGIQLLICRSTDGGTTWDPWASFYDPLPGHRYFESVIAVAEGVEDRVFVAYAFDPDVGYATEVHVAWSPLDLPAGGDFSNSQLIYAGGRVSGVSFTTDAESYSEYFAYLAFSDDEGNGADIHFVRSIDQGTTWEPEYTLAAISVGDRGYYGPEIDIGYGGYVHVVWVLGFSDDHEYDDCLRYRRAQDFAGGGLASWDPMQSLTPHNNDVAEYWPALDASTTSPDVLIVNPRTRRTNGNWYRDGSESRASTDAGANWSDPARVNDGAVWRGDVIHQDATGRWIAGFLEPDDCGFRWAPVSDPGDWSELQDFTDGSYSSGEPALVLDPTHDDRVGALACDGTGAGYTWFFDAEWRSDPGYPVTEPGFPVDLPDEPDSDPAVVDLDGDGDLEIVFVASQEQIFAYHHDGAAVDGFPRGTGFYLSDSPVCVGDLNGDGAMEIVVGTVNGVILAYDADANLLPGWPYLTGYDDPVYLAIGAVGGPYPRAVIWGCGPRLAALDWHGDPYPGSLGRGFSGRTFTQPPSIGDVDGDGRSEVVMGIAAAVYAFPMLETGWTISTGVGATISGPLSLGDLDQDGDVEVVVPLETGALHVLDGDGSAYPGAWPVTVAGSALNGAAIASCLGDAVPEIAVSAHDWLVSVLFDHGGVASGWPVDTDGWNVHGMPVIGELEGSNDIVIGARGSKAWSWNNFGVVNDGWPKAMGANIYRTPAYGDLDQDGSAEIVFLTTDQLWAVDVNNPPSSGYRLWAMAGHDPERSGCANCPLDLVPVADDPDRVTRVSMAAPHPNPIAGAASFAFAVPVRAIAELAIHDVRGRRVALVRRAEVPAGRHVFEWNGRDGDGRPVASGQYLATLRVQGPDLDEHLARKVTVLR